VAKTGSRVPGPTPVGLTEEALNALNGGSAKKAVQKPDEPAKKSATPTGASSRLVIDESEDESPFKNNMAGNCVNPSHVSPGLSTLTANPCTTNTF
jgi:hypothetical protein